MPGDILKIINRHGLKPATKREMTPLGATSLAHAYVFLLKKLIGFSYGAFGSWGSYNQANFLLNERRIAKHIGSAIRRNPRFIQKSLARAKKIHAEVIPVLSKIILVKSAPPLEFFRVVARDYPRYLAAIGIYNCFWRYLGNDASRLPAPVIKKIIERRDRAATLYPKVERAILAAAERFGKVAGVRGTNLACLTFEEMIKFLSAKKLPVREKILGERSKAYLYFLSDRPNCQLLLAGAPAAKLEKKIFGDLAGIKKVSGQIGYPGVATGKVYNLDKNKGARVPKRFVLVASATNPNDIPIIKRALAIVADEGGILGHAAILSREFKIPCVVGAKIATKIFKDGDMVEVDAERGIVRKL